MNDSWFLFRDTIDIQSTVHEMYIFDLEEKILKYGIWDETTR